MEVQYNYFFSGPLSVYWLLWFVWILPLAFALNCFPLTQLVLMCSYASLSINHGHLANPSTQAHTEHQGLTVGYRSNTWKRSAFHGANWNTTGNQIQCTGTPGTEDKQCLFVLDSPSPSSSDPPPHCFNQRGYWLRFYRSGKLYLFEMSCNMITIDWVIYSLEHLSLSSMLYRIINGILYVDIYYCYWIFRYHLSPRS